MKLSTCIGTLTESLDYYAPLNVPCEIVYEKETGLIRSAHGLDNKGGTHFSKYYAKHTKWEKEIIR